MSEQPLAREEKTPQHCKFCGASVKGSGMFRDEPWTYYECNTEYDIDGWNRDEDCKDRVIASLTATVEQQRERIAELELERDEIGSMDLYIQQLRKDLAAATERAERLTEACHRCASGEIVAIWNPAGFWAFRPMSNQQAIGPFESAADAIVAMLAPSEGKEGERCKLNDAQSAGARL